MAKLRIAVIGAGRLGGFHAQKIAARDDLDFVGVVDPNQAARRRVANDCGTKAYAEYEDILSKVDAAVVAAPTHFHHDLGVALLERGIHVLMEKPLCVDGEEAEALVNLAEKRNAILQTGHVERLIPPGNTSASRSTLRGTSRESDQADSHFAVRTWASSST